MPMINESINLLKTMISMKSFSGEEKDRSDFLCGEAVDMLLVRQREHPLPVQPRRRALVRILLQRPRAVLLGQVVRPLEVLAALVAVEQERQRAVPGRHGRR